MAKVVKEQFVMHDATGAVTKDKDKAVSAEVLQEMDDGTHRSTWLRRAPDSEQPPAAGAGTPKP